MTDASQPSSRLLAYMQLCRFPNVFTSLADVAMGFWFTHTSLEPSGPFVLRLMTSGALYTAGMVLNDVCDERQDAQERPHRPIPSGCVKRSTALAISIALFAVSILSAAAIGVFAHHWGPLSIALVLAVFIISYNVHFKRTPGGPLAMGICRMLNVLLGMSAAPALPSTANSVVACGIGLYTAGVTWFAAREATISRRTHLIGGFVTLLAGIALLFSFPWQMPDGPFANWFSFPRWIALAALIGFLSALKFLPAIASPQPRRVQAAVKAAILSIIVLDATVILAVRGPWPAVVILLLLIPAIGLGRWVYST